MPAGQYGQGHLFVTVFAIVVPKSPFCHFGNIQSYTITRTFNLRPFIDILSHFKRLNSIIIHSSHVSNKSLKNRQIQHF
jgi:hypothetical protein